MSIFIGLPDLPKRRQRQPRVGSGWDNPNRREELKDCKPLVCGGGELEKYESVEAVRQKFDECLTAIPVDVGKDSSASVAEKIEQACEDPEGTRSIEFEFFLNLHRNEARGSDIEPVNSLIDSYFQYILAQNVKNEIIEAG